MYNLTKQFEGCQLVAYKCLMGVWSIGYGTTKYPDGTKVKEGDTITQEQADYFLEDYMTKEVLPQLSQYDWLNNNQTEALSSLIYNCGVLAYKCPKLHVALLNKDFEEIFKQWDYGVKNGGGVITRRSEELSTFYRYPYK